MSLCACRSFGWRCILVAVLGELGAVPCLRAGFHHEHTAREALRLGGVNVACPNAGLAPAAAQPESGPGPEEGGAWPLLFALASELGACVGGGPGVRVFQVVLAEPRAGGGPKPEAEALDAVWDAMQARDEAGAHVKRGAAALAAAGSGERDLVVCDVDGCLFDITAELLARDLADTGFFFNSKESVPDEVVPRSTQTRVSRTAPIRHSVRNRAEF